MRWWARCIICECLFACLLALVCATTKWQPLQTNETQRDSVSVLENCVGFASASMWFPVLPVCTKHTHLIPEQIHFIYSACNSTSVIETTSTTRANSNGIRISGSNWQYISAVNEQFHVQKLSAPRQWMITVFIAACQISSPLYCNVIRIFNEWNSVLSSSSSNRLTLWTTFSIKHSLTIITHLKYNRQLEQPINYNQSHCSWGIFQVFCINISNHKNNSRKNGFGSKYNHKI